MTKAVLGEGQTQLFARPLIAGRRFWSAAKDGDTVGFALARRHYSAWKNRKPKQRQFVGPGEPVVLIAPDGDALFVWRKSRYRLDSETGVECTVFRNESTARSSDMVREADLIAWERWPGERHFTHVDPRRVQSSNPGYCFLAAGWRKTGRVTSRGLIVLEKVAQKERE